MASLFDEFRLKDVVLRNRIAVSLTSGIQQRSQAIESDFVVWAAGDLFGGQDEIDS
jgi:2,4-dienoyl-CoA reductase-like NADH-dependent reductase (Old Yellow Enzyme family)